MRRQKLSQVRNERKESSNTGALDGCSSVPQLACPPSCPHRQPRACTTSGESRTGPGMSAPARTPDRAGPPDGRTDDGARSCPRAISPTKLGNRNPKLAPVRRNGLKVESTVVGGLWRRARCPAKIRFALVARCCSTVSEHSEQQATRSDHAPSGNVESSSWARPKNSAAVSRASGASGCCSCAYTHACSI
jgi:hypothetical protein